MLAEEDEDGGGPAPLPPLIRFGEANTDTVAGRNPHGSVSLVG